MIFDQSLKKDIQNKKFHVGTLNVHWDNFPTWNRFIPWYDQLWKTDTITKVKNGKVYQDDWLRIYNENNRGFFIAPPNTELEHFPIIQYIAAQAKKHLNFELESWHLYLYKL